MIVASYTRELAKIKLELSKYSHASVFNCAVNYLDQGRTLKNMPWIVMFFLKHSLLGDSGPREISSDEFLKLANRVYKLSNKLLGQSNEIFMLMLRAMIIQQASYQVPVIDSWRQIILQRVLLEKSSDFNNELFFRKTGITLNNYYKIASYLLSISGKENSNAAIRWGLSTFYSHLSPALSDDVLIKFLNLVAIPFQGLPEYLRKYAISDSNSAELYQETPFKQKPIILENDGLVIINAGLCVSGLTSIAIDILKGSPKFYRRFGVDVEDYIGNRLRVTPMKVYSMPELNNVIPIKVGKIADYVAVDKDDIFIFESKAITPSVLMKCAYDPSQLSTLLEESFIKGIEQGQETAFKLSGIDGFRNKRVRIIVVTLEDFHIYGGEYVAHYIKAGFEFDLVGKYGCLPVSLQDVIYMTLKDLITLTEWAKDKPIGSISKIFEDVESASKEPGGARFSISPHISARIGHEVEGPVGVGDAVGRTQAEILQLLTSNSKTRSRQHPVEYMVAFEQFRKRLQQSIAM